MKLNGRLVSRDQLHEDKRAELLCLMQRHYDNVVPKLFEADLAEKKWVILVTDPATNELCGFSTQMMLDATVEDRSVKALFSGDTIIDQDHWGDQALAHVWGNFALSLIDEHQDEDLYWFLICGGYKTYRFLPVFFHEFYPRHDANTPPQMQAVLDGLASTKFADQYDAAAGVIRAHADQYRLRAGVADITPERLDDPHVRFFAQRNPGHTGGDELCCIAPLSRDNFTRAAYRVIGHTS